MNGFLSPGQPEAIRSCFPRFHGVIYIKNQETMTDRMPARLADMKTFGEDAMDRHVLLTISDDVSSLQAVRFTAGYFTGASRLLLTLLYIASNPKAGLPESEIIHNHNSLNQRTAQAKARAQAVLDKAEELLLLKHFPADRIHKKIAFKQLGTATDIIQESISGMYDAVVLGRRGLSRLEEFISGSVSREIFSAPMEVPLWICRRQERVNPHLLLCVDGSPSGRRCADHVGFMLREEARHRIDILHVATPGTGTAAGKILEEARCALEANGIAPERIGEKVIESPAAAKTILDQALTGGYGVVAAGRKTPDGAASTRITGSSSTVLLKSLDFAALWISA